MKLLNIIAVIAILIIFALIVTINKQKSPIIELPEEYKLISKDSLIPDTLIGYYINDTLIINFKPKHYGN